MRQANIDTLLGDEIVAKTIFDSSGRALITEGTRFKKSFIEKLKSFGIFSIWVNDRISANVVIDEKISEQTRTEATSIVKQSLTKLSFCKHDIDKVMDIAMKILQDVLSSNLIYDLKDIKIKDDYTFQHCINVSVLAALVGCKLKMDQDKIKDMVTGCLLHDVGKIQIPDYILNKPGKLDDDEFEEIKRHPSYGYNILNENIEIHPVTKVVVLLHHEKFDGTGYPLKMSGSKIHESARIAAICDVFDALTSDRPYRKAWSTGEALEYLHAKSGTDFDPDIVKVFQTCVTPYPNGTIVQLNTKDIAIVVSQNKTSLNKPKVQLLYNKSSRGNYPDNIIIDLSSQTDFKIEMETEIDYVIYLKGRVKS